MSEVDGKEMQGQGQEVIHRPLTDDDKVAALTRVAEAEKKATEASAPAPGTPIHKEGEPPKLSAGVYLLHVDREGRGVIDGQIEDVTCFPFLGKVAIVGKATPWKGSVLERMAMDLFPGTKPGPGNTVPVTNTTITGIHTDEQHIIGSSNPKPTPVKCESKQEEVKH